MQTWEAIESRRNVRSFSDRPIPAVDLDQILEAGRRSPSSQNWQPWDFILVTDREQLRELSKVFVGAGHVAGSAATIVVIGPAADNEFHRAQLDLGQATMAMTLAATDLGIGSCHAGERGPLAAFWAAVRELDPDAADESELAGVREGDLARLFTQAGLNSVQAGALTVRVRHASFDDWWERFTLGVGPAGIYVTSLTAERRTALREQCRRLLPAAAIEITAVAWAVSGRS